MNDNLKNGDLNRRYANGLAVPKINDLLNKGGTSLNLAQPDIWVVTGQYVEKGKFIRFNWSTVDATAGNPKRYKVLYRIDTRFNRPQIFIKTFNNKTKKYEATDFPKFNSSDPTKDYASLAFNKIQDYVDYFAFSGSRKQIRVEKGDVINITLTGDENFFGVNTEDRILTQEADTNNLKATMLYTNSNLNNKIIYSSTQEICHIVDPVKKDICQSSDPTSNLLQSNNNMVLVGKPLALPYV